MQRTNPRQVLIIGVVVVAVVLIIGLYLITRGGGGSGGGTAQASVPVLVSLQNINQGTTFRQGQPLAPFFAVKQVPASLVPFGAYRSLTGLSAAIKSASCLPVTAPGCAGEITTTQTIFQNLPVVSGMFTTLGQFRQSVGPAFQIPYGYVGIAMNLNEVNSVLGSIHPGDTVDMMASYTGTGRNVNIRAPSQTQYIMTNLKVIGVGGPPPGPSTTTVNGGTAPPPAAATAGAGGSLLILAKYQEALEIQHLKDFGWQLSAVLRSAKATDIKHFKTLPVTDRWFFVKSSNPFKANPGY